MPKYRSARNKTMKAMSDGGPLSELRRVPAALWALARAALAPRLARQVECDRVLASALAGLRAPLQAAGARRAHLRAAGAEVPGGSLPRVRADARQLERVFRVLVGNAVRHRGEE